MAAVTEPGRMTPGRGASPRRLAGSLTTRIGALALAAVLLTSVVGAAAAVILVQRATDRAAVSYTRLDVYKRQVRGPHVRLTSGRQARLTGTFRSRPDRLVGAVRCGR